MPETSKDIIDFIVKAETKKAEGSIGRLVSQTTKLTKAGGKLARVYETADKSLMKVTHTLDKTGKRLATTATHTKELQSGFLGLGESLGHTIKKVAMWTISTGAIFGTVSALKKGIGTITEFDSQMVSLQKVFRGTTRDLEAIKQEVLSISVEMGSLTQDTMGAAIALGRMGKTRQEIAELTRVSLLSQNIAEMEAVDATRLLNAAILQFEKTADDAIEILDKWNELSNRTPVTTRDMAESMSIAGAVFHQAGGEIEDLNAMTATLTATMAKNGREIGNAIKTISTYAYRQRTMSDVLELTNIAIEDEHGNLMDIDELLARLSAKWKMLTEAEQEELAQTVAGVRRKGFFLNLMENFDMVLENQIIQWQAAGSAIQENEIRLGSLATKIDQLGASFERLAIQTGDKGALGGMKYMVDQLRELVENINDMSGVAQGLTTAGGIGLALLFSKWGKAAKGALAGIGGLATAFASLGKGMQIFLKAAGWIGIVFGVIQGIKLLTDVLAKNNRELRDQIKLQQENIDRLKIQKQKYTSLLDAIEMYNALYDGFKKLEEASEGTAIAEERLRQVLEAIQVLQPGLIKDIDDFGEAHKILKGEIDDVTQSLKDLRDETYETMITKIELELPEHRKAIEKAISEITKGIPMISLGVAYGGEIPPQAGIEQDYIGLLNATQNLASAEEYRNYLWEESGHMMTGQIKNFDILIKRMRELADKEEKISDYRAKKTKKDEESIKKTIDENWYLTEEEKKIINLLDKEAERHWLAEKRIEGTEVYIEALRDIAWATADDVKAQKLLNQADELELRLKKQTAEETQRLADAKAKTREKQVESISDLQDQVDMQQRMADGESELNILLERKTELEKHLEDTKAKELEDLEAEIELLKIILRITQLVSKESTWEKAWGRIGDSLYDALFDSTVLALSSAATKAQKLRVWNQLANRIGDVIGEAISNSIAKAKVFKADAKETAAEAGGAAIGSKIGSFIPVVGDIVGAVVGSLIGGGIASLLGAEEPIEEETQALEENTRSIRELTDEMRDFREDFINMPSTFMLGATRGDIPQFQDSGRVLRSGLAYVDEDEWIGRPDQLAPYISNISNINQSRFNITINQQPGQNAGNVVDEIERRIAGGYLRGAEYSGGY